MRGKLLFVAGLGAGYVVGARAGRPAYEAIAARLRGTVADPKVQEVGRKAKEALAEKAPKVAAVADQVAGTVAGAADAVAEAPSGEAGGSSADDAPADAPGSPPKPGAPAVPGSSTRGTASTGTPGPAPAV